jgi:hypothetical protein
MEHSLFRGVKREIRRAGRRRGCRRQAYTDGTIVEVYFWAVINDRPTCWATRPGNWPPGLRRGPLPSQPCVSRRLRTAPVRALIDRVERLLRRRDTDPLVTVFDGRPLPVGPHSHDRHATWGRGAGGFAKGYKLHALFALGGDLVAWRLAPMNVDEREMLRRLQNQTRLGGYLLADANLDSNSLFDNAGRHGGQLVSPRRKGAARGLGRGYQSPARLRCRDLLENTVSAFGRELYEKRVDVERFFGYHASTSGLLNGLPAWVRTYPRVRLWVQAKLLLGTIRKHIRRRERQPDAA